ncbi:hypothetical protein JEOAER750_00575 [Jeotgalicoccus aerolatus]|uniref:DUF3784 domain-containing protein n=2 Tax=Jeotgalicoccus TaxID=227979 RepID=A0A6V7R1G5_9STAP|nr:hypothetical protein [Jeotgalicoccus coquinae]MBP1953083.1 glucan phosphoethanolaminetransferase (alkaline phosphatase superfamily) [Jeotgalicoccus aerolatus]CAD2071177.1 hypothetical protein JEOCOQ751_00152 [Jeotgalicoccus coquinae]CAD2073043.1 hypothetical protein JEOAER750_00575 [Jeotgalicoccus aerolatus]GGE02312.1 hypothetical protein GCM10007273_13580 [Jeotgalicoccus aerolatus]
MYIDIIIGAVISLVMYSFGLYVYKTNNLNIIASIDTSDIPKETWPIIAKLFYKISIVVSFTLFVLYVSFSFSYFLTLIAIILLFLELIYFYVKFKSITK